MYTVWQKFPETAKYLPIDILFSKNLNNEWTCKPETIISFCEETRGMHTLVQVWEKISDGWKIVKMLRDLHLW